MADQKNSQTKGRTSFPASALKSRGRETIRDQDNAQPRPRPPFALDHPKLAPKGVSGIKSSERLGLPPQLSKRPRLHHGLGKPSDVNKEFKSVAGPSKDKGQSHEI